MFYTRIIVRCDPALTDILTAELAEAGFDAFIETTEGFDGFTEGMNYDEEMVENIRHRYAQAEPGLAFIFEKIEQQNWNEAWEKSYESVVIAGQCMIRAEFHHPKERYPYEIIITPKMSFGTGHHQTTHLMVQAQLALDHKGKRVMDAGCGTAVLSVMASKLGAIQVQAFDIDDWSVSNGRENAGINGCSNVTIGKGTLREQVFTDVFDIILANINKNVLLSDMELMRSHLAHDGKMLISGFYRDDIPEILLQAGKFDIRLLRAYDKDNWAALLLAV